MSDTKTKKPKKVDTGVKASEKKQKKKKVYVAVLHTPEEVLRVVSLVAWVHGEIGVEDWKTKILIANPKNGYSGTIEGRLSNCWLDKRSIYDYTRSTLMALNNLTHREYQRLLKIIPKELALSRKEFGPLYETLIGLGNAFSAEVADDALKTIHLDPIESNQGAIIIPNRVDDYCSGNLLWNMFVRANHCLAAVLLHLKRDERMKLVSHMIRTGKPIQVYVRTERV